MFPMERKPIGLEYLRHLLHIRLAVAPRWWSGRARSGEGPAISRQELIAHLTQGWETMDLNGTVTIATGHDASATRQQTDVSDKPPVDE